MQALLSQLLSTVQPLFIPDPGEDAQLRLRGVVVNVTAEKIVADPMKRRGVGILMKNRPADLEALAKVVFHLRLLSQVHFRRMRRFAFFNPVFLQMVNEHAEGASDAAVGWWGSVGVTVGRYAYDLSLEVNPELLPAFCAAFHQPVFNVITNGDYLAHRMAFAPQWAEILYGGQARRFCRRLDFSHFQRVPMQFINHALEVGWSGSLWSIIQTSHKQCFSSLRLPPTPPR